VPVDIGLDFQIKAVAGGVRFRCSINNNQDRAPFVPANKIDNCQYIRRLR
jgi:hypothetical protein